MLAVYKVIPYLRINWIKSIIFKQSIKRAVLALIILGSIRSNRKIASIWIQFSIKKTRVLGEIPTSCFQQQTAK